MQWVGWFYGSHLTDLTKTVLSEEFRPRKKICPSSLTTSINVYLVTDILNKSKGLYFEKGIEIIPRDEVIVIVY